MGYYRPANRPDRIKAFAGVLLVHAGLAAVILTGLDVKIVAEQVERLTTMDIAIDEPPPPVREPPPKPQESSASKDEAAPPNVESKPTPVVAPTPPIPLPLEQKINTAQVRGPEGLDRTAGAAAVPGSGTGAGGQGNGFGGGGLGGSGSGSGDGFTPARMLNKIPDREYRRISGGRIRQGSATITFRVNPDGRASHCRVVRSSGDPMADAAVCSAATSHLRFRPARDPSGRAVAQDITYTPSWRPNSW